MYIQGYKCTHLMAGWVVGLGVLVFWAVPTLVVFDFVFDFQLGVAFAFCGFPPYHACTKENMY